MLFQITRAGANRSHGRCFRSRGRMSCLTRLAAVARASCLSIRSSEVSARHQLFRQIRRQILAAIDTYHIDRVVVLMSHVWTPLLANSIRRAGVRYVVIVHDAADHPGDATAMVNSWLLRDALKADEVVTLSAYVRSRLVARFPQLADRTSVLFLPILRSITATRQANPADQVGFLFFGRVLAYKGLSLFVEACELLRARNQSFRCCRRRRGKPRRMGRPACRAQRSRYQSVARLRRSFRSDQSVRLYGSL